MKNGELARAICFQESAEEGNADSIAESDFIRIFIHSVVDILLKWLAIRAPCLLALYKNPRMKSDND